MRNALGLMLVSVVAAALIATGGWFWTSPARSSARTQAVAAAQPAPAALPSPAKPVGARDPIEVTGSISERTPPIVAPQPKQACANPDALGVSRIVEIDTSGGPGFGFEHFKQIDFLTDKEVVLTFDDGPWPGNTPAVLKALADECTKAVFFSIGKHATYHPAILKQVAAAGHTVGTHTWSHANLNSKKLNEQSVKDEIEKGNSAVKFALGTAPAPFFRFPELQHNQAAMAYLGTRNIAMFSCDLDSFDFRAKNADQIITTVMTKLEKQGKGIILMHDFQKHTAEAMPELLRRLKAGGYKVVLMRPKAPMQTLAEYDEALIKDLKLPTAGARPVNTIVQTVSQ
jgi:peptidoglycan/xylan/chitin deacetylase (PgdA/CDA1 family)